MNREIENHPPERSVERLESQLTWFREARKRDQLSEEKLRLATSVAIDEFFVAFADGAYLREAVTLIVEIASLPDAGLSRLGLRALFPELIERLNDSFAPEACAVHDRIIAQVIDHCRRLPEGGGLDRMLNRFGLTSEADLLARKESLRASLTQPNRLAVRKIIILSRVTIGADVAVTSVIIGHLKRLAPDAELIWIGPSKLAELYAGDPRLRLHAANYDRGGHLLDRLLSWLPLLTRIEQEAEGLDDGELWVVDPDSRMTQLGMLPINPPGQHYFHFESRSFQAPDGDRLSHLAARWCETELGSVAPARPTHPFIALTDAQIEVGQKVISRLRREKGRKVISMSFGVGGNPSKRLREEFEARLLTALSSRAALLIDKGGTPDEYQTIERMIDRLRRTEIKIVEAREGASLNDDPDGCDLMTWEGGIGSFASLVRASDQYVGYDSAGQHIAAAQGVPTLTIFVNSGSRLFAQRWHPSGPGLVKVLAATKSDVDESETLAAVLREI